ncbi:MAG: hypothetical protein GW875_07740 [Deltaproteobacteria bacterium]|nr:hypothetical protein [Deltaproteobacteria bacterium]NCP02962.1 hypothetical protein [Deltaproteobacteria bacterium]NCP78210.1 hypothetical protein [Desulfuromonadales bacterium]
MGREYVDRFSEASKESGEKSSFACETCGTVLTHKQHAEIVKKHGTGMIRKITAGGVFKDPSPFGP